MSAYEGNLTITVDQESITSHTTFTYGVNGGGATLPRREPDPGRFTTGEVSWNGIKDM